MSSALEDSCHSLGSSSTVLKVAVRSKIKKSHNLLTFILFQARMFIFRIHLIFAHHF